MNDIENRMKELMVPIEQQIMMCDSEHDMLLMACAMLQRTREIFDHVLGPSGRMRMFKEYAERSDFD
jgi:hypothetical protein